MPPSTISNRSHRTNNTVRSNRSHRSTIEGGEECLICSCVIGRPRGDQSVETETALTCVDGARHTFGSICLSTWLMNNPTCPHCRHPISGTVRQRIFLQTPPSLNATGDVLTAAQEANGQTFQEMNIAEGDRYAAQVANGGASTVSRRSGRSSFSRNPLSSLGRSSRASSIGAPRNERDYQRRGGSFVGSPPDSVFLEDSVSNVGSSIAGGSSRHHGGGSQAGASQYGGGSRLGGSRDGRTTPPGTTEEDTYSREPNGLLTHSYRGVILRQGYGSFANLVPVAGRQQSAEHLDQARHRLEAHLTAFRRPSHHDRDDSTVVSSRHSSRAPSSVASSRHGSDSSTVVPSSYHSRGPSTVGSNRSHRRAPLSVVSSRSHANRASSTVSSNRHGQGSPSVASSSRRSLDDDWEREQDRNRAEYEDAEFQAGPRHDSTWLRTHSDVTETDRGHNTAVVAPSDPSNYSAAARRFYESATNDPDYFNRSYRSNDSHADGAPRRNPSRSGSSHVGSSASYAGSSSYGGGSQLGGGSRHGGGSQYGGSSY